MITAEIYNKMEKEVRAMLDKGEKVTLVAIDEQGNHFIGNKNYTIDGIYKDKAVIKSELNSIHFFNFDELHQYFKLPSKEDSEWFTEFNK